MSKQKFYLVNPKLEITEEYLDTTSEYFDYCSPWRFNTMEEAKEYIKEKIRKQIKEIDKEIVELTFKSDELVKRLFSIKII